MIVTWSSGITDRERYYLREVSEILDIWVIEWMWEREELKDDKSRTSDWFWNDIGTNTPLSAAFKYYVN